jgi:hypothetical protein
LVSILDMNNFLKIQGKLKHINSNRSKKMFEKLKEVIIGRPLHNNELQ